MADHQATSSAAAASATAARVTEMLNQELRDVATLPADTAAFKNSELPLARIKKIMKLDEDIKGMMIAAEAPLLFAKAAELLIKELTLRAWIHTERSRRRTLQRADISASVYDQDTDQFDFLIDIVPREDPTPAAPVTTPSRLPAAPPPPPPALNNNPAPATAAAAASASSSSADQLGVPVAVLAAQQQQQQQFQFQPQQQQQQQVQYVIQLGGGGAPGGVVGPAGMMGGQPMQFAFVQQPGGGQQVMQFATTAASVPAASAVAAPGDVIELADCQQFDVKPDISQVVMATSGGGLAAGIPVSFASL